MEIIIKENILKYDSQCSRSMHVLVMLIKLRKYLLFFTTTFRCFHDICVMVCLDTNILLFFLSIFLDLIFLFFQLFFSFSFFFDDKEACDCCHMTYHMIWSQRPRLSESKLKEARRMTWYSYRKYKGETW